jgi:hypothetical protein
MRLQKMHPDFDGVLGEILRRDPNGEVVLFDDHTAPEWSAIVADRFLESMPDVAHRVRFRTWAAKREEFLSILARADVIPTRPGSTAASPATSSSVSAPPSSPGPRSSSAGE